MRQDLTTRSIILDKREVRDWTVVRELIFVYDGFLEKWRNNRFFKNGVELTRSE